MYRPVSTKDAYAVEAEVQAIYRSIFPEGKEDFVRTAFGWAKQCFTGQYPNYRAIDARYHDFEHTLQGTLCMAQLLQQRHQAGAEPFLTERHLQLGFVAILFHDTGYLKTLDDPEGTGAKYTLIHVSRSIDFAGQFLAKKGFAVADIRAVQHMIRCTGVNVDLAAIPFQEPIEQLVGFALGTADLLGQMAAADYVDKLPILYQEFAEAQRFGGTKSIGLIPFSSARDLKERTPSFWKYYVWPKIHTDFQALYRYLNNPFPDGPNLYLDRIRANLSRVEQELAGTPR